MSLTAPETSGTYYYGACADSIPLESDTSNNCSDSLQVIVEPPPAPDLVVDTPTVSDSSLTAGDTFTLSFTVRNHYGNRSSGWITLRYYRSDNAEFDSLDALIYSKTEREVPYGGARTIPYEIRAHPWSTGHRSYSRPGTYYYIVCVDPVSDESDTTNNCSIGVAVTATPLTASRTCIVGYVITPFDKCSHPDESSLIYLAIGGYTRVFTAIYSANQIDTIVQTDSGGTLPNSSRTTKDIWINGIKYHMRTILTSALNERIIELSSSR